MQGILLCMIEMQCVVTGKVQGVAYCAYVQDAADELELTGWVQNASDGTVLVCAQGQPTVLKEFVEYLHEGSLMAEVEAVSVEWGSVQQAFDDFSIKH
jgi:acylphosphatase